MTEVFVSDDEMNRWQDRIKIQDELIYKQEEQLQALQEARINDEHTLGKLESILQKQNQSALRLKERRVALKDSRDNLEKQYQTKTEEVNTQNKQLQELSTQVGAKREELEETQVRHDALAKKVHELTIEKLRLQQENTELQKYKEKVDCLEEQLRTMHLESEGLKTGQLKVEQLVLKRSDQLQQLKKENQELMSILKSKEEQNKELEKQVAELVAIAGEHSRTEAELKSVKQKIADKDKQIKKYKRKTKELHSHIKDLKQESNRKISEMTQQLNAKLEELQNEMSRGREQIMCQVKTEREDPLCVIENEQLKKELSDLKKKYTRLKEEKSEVTAELFEVKLQASHIEDDLECAESKVVRLTNERDELKARVRSSENYVAQCCQRMKEAEKETQILRNHIATVNANQAEMAVVQMENTRLAKRMGALETDLEDYTERQRTNVIKKKKTKTKTGKRR